jgi:diguanylate cyclase (GGDEF)-like protein
MPTHDDIELTEEELRLARERADRLSMVLTMIGALVIAVFSAGAAAIGINVAEGAWRYPATGIASLLLGIPVVAITSKATKDQNDATAAAMDALRSDLKNALEEAEGQASKRELQARRQEFESRLANALEMAEGEPEVIDVVERAFDATLPGAPIELLLADNSHAHLSRVAATGVEDHAPMCGVDSPDHCPAARRAQVQRFGSSEALDTCPKLRNRASGDCSAVCVPVSIMGRTVGVIHATGAPGAVFDDTAVQDLGTLANLAGARIGLLRMVADTQLQAATDSLTGLLNRRSLENKARVLGPESSPRAVVMADLDHFKQLNDTFGHQTGDRALRLFARTLSGALRTDDLVCRHGGEEFAVVLPRCPAGEAATIMERVRSALTAVCAEAGLPNVTASFGVVESDHLEDLAEALQRADVALFEAKEHGRDRVVVHDGAGRLEAELAALPTTVV